MSGEEDRSRPTFSGNTMPMNINPICLDEGGEETTRRVAFQPSFESLSSFTPICGGEKTYAFSSKSSQRTDSAAKSLVNSRAKGVWQLRSVPVLPEYHPLERTAVFVPYASPSDVSMRISDVLRERSIEAVYDDEKAKAKCVTSDGVDFRVRLYRGRNSFNHGVIVEVQRRFGVSNTFYSDTMAILDAAEGKVPPPLAFESTSLPRVDDIDDSAPIDGSSSLEMVSKMLSHHGYDAHYLALQTLASLTNASKMGSATARGVSMELLRQDVDHVVATKVLSLVMDKKKDDDTVNLRSMALLVVANAFQALKGNVPRVLKDRLRSVLIQDLRRAQTAPRNAVQAARVLEFFVPEDTGSDLLNALETALETGSATHSALERQAQICLDKLE